MTKFMIKATRLYGCEFCLVRLHATCVFPNASDSKLKTLFEFNTGFCVMCRDCKQNFNDQRCLLATKNDVKELVDAVKLQTQGRIQGGPRPPPPLKCKLRTVAARDYFKQVGYMIRKAGQNKYSL